MTYDPMKDKDYIKIFLDDERFPVGDIDDG